MEHSVIGKSIAWGIIILFIVMSVAPLGNSQSRSTFADQQSVAASSNTVKTSGVEGVNMTVGGTHGNNGWYISPVTLFFTSDNGTPVVFYRFFNESWLPWTDGPIVVTQQGNITFQWYWVDWDGTVSPIHTLWLHIDYTSPVVNVTTERIGWRKWKINVTAYDNISGLDFYELWIGPYLQYEGRFPWPYGIQSVVWILSPIPRIKVNFTIVVWDVAGNNNSGVFSKSYSQNLQTIQQLLNTVLKNS